MNKFHNAIFTKYFVQALEVYLFQVWLVFSG